MWLKAIRRSSTIIFTKHPDAGGGSGSAGAAGTAPAGTTSAGGKSGGVGTQKPTYQATEYSTVITAFDPRTGEKKTVKSTRKVWQREGIDPNMKIPAGTVYGNGRVVTKDTTNRELMKKGQAPFVLVKTKDGKWILSQVELHHTTSQETYSGAEHFTGKEQDGTLMEVPSYIHKTNHGVLHINQGEGSFRTDDKTGGKSFDAHKYDRFRRKYWKERLKQLGG